MHSKFKDSVVSNVFEYIFFRFNKDSLRDDDQQALTSAQRDASERFKCDKGQSLLAASEAYLDRFGSMPSWSYKWFEKLAGKLIDKDMKNYLKAVCERD